MLEANALAERDVPDYIEVDHSKMAAKLAAGPTGAIGRTKRMLNAAFSNDLTAQLALEHECQIESGRSDDFKEGVTAFLEKRPPNFSGK